MNPQNVQVNININEEIKKGRYANHFRITRSPHEVTLDFVFIHPETGGDYIARVIVHPAFLQEIAKLLGAQAAKPEITKSSDSKTRKIGFHADSGSKDLNVKTS